MHPHRVFAALLATAVALALAAGPAIAARTPDPAPDAGSSAIIFLAEDTAPQRVIDELERRGVSSADIEVRRRDMLVVTVDPRGAARASTVAADIPGVTATGLDGTVQALESIPPSDPAYLHDPYAQRDYYGPASLAPHSIHLEPVWDSIFDGVGFTAVPDRPGVPVAVIDTGASPSFLENTGNYRSMWDYVNDDADASDDAWRIGYHGTRVSSIIESQTDNDWGIAGVTYDLDVEVMVYKCLDSAGNGSSADCMQAMRDATDAGAKVINLSFGERATISNIGTTPDLAVRAAWQDTVDYCVAHGAVVVAASGNAADDATPYTPVYYPAACDGAVAVGSIDVSSGLRSAFSCYGPELDLVAPGQYQPDPQAGVWSTRPSGTSDVAAVGTSFASPMVTGSVAVLWSLVPDLPSATITGLVLQSADASYGDLQGFDQTTGWGLLDVWAGYDEMTQTIPAQTPVTVSTTQPDGLETRVSWTPASGTGVTYLYGYRGGSAYATSATSGRLVLPGDGTHEVWVRSFARDRWGAQRDATASVVVDGGFSPIRSIRLAGADRYETAAAVARASFASRTARVAVVASGADWPDALAASTLAHLGDGPIVLSKRTSLPVATRDVLRELMPDTVFVIGGTAALSDQVQADIETTLPLGTKIVRLGGVDRYDTARLVAQYVASLPGASTSTIVLASGQNYPDALSAAPAAAAAGWPVLLTRTGALPQATASALATLRPSRSYVAGGSGAIADSVLGALPNPVRWAGADRYATSRVIADQARLLGILTAEQAGFATGRSFPDALSAGPYAASVGEPVVLADSVTSQSASWLSAQGDIQDITLFGGSNAVSYDTEFDIMNALRSAATP